MIETGLVKKLFLVMLMCIITVVEMKALDQGEEIYPYHVDYFTNDAGLPQNTVHDIFLDQFGFIWFGTGNGLARYDGYSFKNYGKERLSSNLINSLAGTSDGLLWVGTNKGLCHIDLTTDEVVVFELSGEAGTVPVINTLFVDDKDNLWVGTAANGIYQLQKESDGYVVLHYNVMVNGTTNPAINALIAINDGIILGGTEDGLFTIDSQKGISAMDEMLISGLLDQEIDVRSLFLIDNKLWIGTFFGLLVYDTNSHQEKWYLPDSQNENALVHGTVNDIVADQFGTIYLGTLGGLEIFEPAIDGFLHFPQDGPEDFKLNNSFIRSLLTDEKGNVWVGTEKGGVNHFNLYQKSFYFLTHEVENDNSLSEGPVNSILRDEDVLWVGTAGGGLNMVRPDQNEVRNYRYNPNDEESLSSDFVPAIAKDNKGQLWVSTWGAGLNKMLPNGKFRRYGVGTGEYANSPYNAFVSSLMFDERGFLLIGTEGGLAILNTDTENIVLLDEGPLSGISEVGCILKDSDGYYWIGTRQGLFRFPSSLLTANGVLTARDNHVTVFTTDLPASDDSPASLAGNYVVSLTEDQDGNIWAGTYGDGVSCIRQIGEDDWHFTNYSTSEGLSNNVIYGILEDQNGHLWMSTDQGLSRFDRESQSFFNFYREDGLLSNQFYWSAAYRSEDGILYFGNIKGLNYFNPRSFPDYPFKPEVFINGLRVFNKPVQPGEERHNQVVLSESIYLTDTVSLSYRDNVITFEFAAIDYFHPQKIKYAYKLDGVDIDWVEVSSQQRFANYTNLDGGFYQFRVKATNSDGVWNSDQRVITLHVRPPFWQTTWFKILLLIMILTLIVIYAKHHTRRLRAQKRTLENMVRERTRQIEAQKNHMSKQADELVQTNKVLEHRQELIEGQKNELESKNTKILEQRDRLITLNKKVKAINQSKLRFFTNVSHEFRTPLTLILAPLENLMEDKSLPEGVHDSLNTIERNARRLLLLINQLLTFRKMESGKFQIRATRGNPEQFLNEIFHAFEGLAADHNIEYKSRIAVPSEGVWFDPEKLENILYNLLSNAFKFTPDGGQVVFSSVIEKDNQTKMLIIEVSDSGAGIPEKETGKIFERFYRVGESTEKSKGSGIGLALALELTEALHGTISVDSHPGQGTTFKVKLPCGREAFSADEIELDEKGPVLSDELREKVKVIRDEMALPLYDNDTVTKADTARNTILVVEDNRELGALIKKSFEDEYEVMEAENGQEAYELAKDHKIDLVISDIMMPVMNGIDLCNHLKNNIYTSHVPVILLSARTLVEHQLEGLKTGADDYIAKPFSMRLLRVRARNLIESRRNLRSLFSKSKGDGDLSIDAVSSLDQQFIEKSFQVLEEHFVDADFSVENFAAAMFVSRSLLYKKLKALAGLSPNDFITVYRLKKSLSYLKSGAVSVNEVAYKIGFNDPKYFSRVFKKFYRETPSEHMRRKNGADPES